jgi:hypothetical protein
MSLELAIQANTAAIQTLVGILSSSTLGVSADVLRPQAAVGNNNTASDTADSTFDKPEVVAKKKKPATASAKLTEDDTLTAVEEVAVGVTLTYEDVKNAVLTLSTTKNRDAAVAVLKQFGASKLTEVEQDRWPEVIAACEAA